MENKWKLVVCVVLCETAGALGAVLGGSGMQAWYASLQKPSFTPPGWVFAPVWIALYFLMGVALYLVWRRGLQYRKVQTAVLLFVLQLVLNVLWTAFFFGMRSPLAGMIDIALLWLAVLATVIVFFMVSIPAGLLLIPYLAWLSYAAVLNLSILRLN